MTTRHHIQQTALEVMQRVTKATIYVDQSNQRGRDSEKEIGMALGELHDARAALEELEATIAQLNPDTL